MNVRTAMIALVMVVVATTGAAQAEPFDDYVAALAASPGRAVPRAAHCGTLVLPTGAVRPGCALALADLTTAAGAPTLRVRRNVVRRLSDSVASWRDAQVDVVVAGRVVASLRVFEVVTDGGPDGAEAIAVTHWVRLVTDREVRARLAAETLPTPTPVIDHTATPTGAATGQMYKDTVAFFESIDRQVRDLTDVGALATQALREGGAVLGSGPGEVWRGTSGLAKLKRWKLGIAQRGPMTIVGTWYVGCVVTQVQITTTGRQPATWTSPTVLVFTQRISGGGSPVDAIRLVSFGVAN